MSKVFGTIAAVFLAAGAFVAYKNQEAYKEEIKTFQGEQATEKSTTKEFNKQTARYNAADEERKDLVAKEGKAAKELEEVTTLYDAAKKKVDELKAKHKQNETQIASAEEDMKGLPDPDVLIPKIQRMTSELAEANSGIASEEAKLANLVLNDKNGKKRIEGLRKTLSDYATGKSLANMRTSISSVYRNWGFVILGAGDKQGVVSGSTLDVTRGGEVVAKLKVTAVEAGRSAADIVLDSVAEGVTIRPGDTVVPEKAAEPAAPAAPDASATAAQ